MKKSNIARDREAHYFQCQLVARHLLQQQVRWQTKSLVHHHFVELQIAHLNDTCTRNVASLVFENVNKRATFEHRCLPVVVCEVSEVQRELFFKYLSQQRTHISY
jgi:hypothetical protein